MVLSQRASRYAAGRSIAAARAAGLRSFAGRAGAPRGARAWHARLRHPAGPLDPDVVEVGGAWSPASAVRRRCVRAGAASRRRDSPARAARPRVDRPAHARGRRQRAHEHPGQLGRLRNAAGGEPVGGAHHADRARPRRRDLRRARHRHHEAGISLGRGNRRFPRLQAARRSAGAFQSRQAPARRRPAQRVHAQLQPAGARVADHAALRHQLDLGCDQGLPALWQVQAGLRDARAARQSALLAAQQDPRDFVADRGVPVRGADAPRRLDPSLRRVLRRRGSLHRVPQVRAAVPGRHRLRRRIDGDARSVAAHGQEALQRGHRRRDGLSERHQSRDDQARAQGDARMGLQSATARQSRAASRSRARRPRGRRRRRASRR